MKILILSFYYQPDLCAGSFRITALVEQLQQLGGMNCQIEVISTLPNRYATYSVQAPEYEQQDNLEVHRIRLPNHQSGMFDQIKAFYCFYHNALKLIKHKQYDLVVATSSRLFTAFLGARIARNINAPLYLDIRDIFIDSLKDVLPSAVSKLVLPVFKQFERYTFAKAGKVNLVSEGFLDYFLQYYPSLDYEVFTNGIDEEFIHAQKKTNKTPDGTGDGEVKIILYAGNIGEGQGLHKIVPQLGKQLGNGFLLKVIGDGGRKQLLVDAISALGVNNVQLLPPVSRDKLIEYYHQADILFLHLNDYDAFKKVLPSKVFEYAAFNKPMLAGVSGYAADFIRDNVSNASVFNPCDVRVAKLSAEELAFNQVHRSDFISRFRRKNIMQKMAQSIIKTAIKL